MVSFKSKWLEILYSSNYVVICKIEAIMEEEHKVSRRVLWNYNAGSSIGF